MLSAYQGEEAPSTEEMSEDHLTSHKTSLCAHEEENA